MNAPHRGPRRLVLLGHPVLHSLSPQFQNAALAAAGIAVTYEAWDVPPHRLDEAIARLRAEEAGGNVTVPHKAAVAALADTLRPVAERTAAVNVFWTENGTLIGDNTDVVGFDEAASTLGVTKKNAIVVCIGAGGAASAVCAAVSEWPGAVVRIVNRSADRAESLANRFPSIVRHATNEPFNGATLIVNATSVGLHPGDALPAPVESFPRDADVMDLVYRPGETAFVHAARAHGHRAIDGIEMLLRQGAAAFERWFHQRPDLEVMRRALQPR